MLRACSKRSNRCNLRSLARQERKASNKLRAYNPTLKQLSKRSAGGYTPKLGFGNLFLDFCSSIQDLLNFQKSAAGNAQAGFGSYRPTTPSYGLTFENSAAVVDWCNSVPATATVVKSCLKLVKAQFSR